jgi:hypothetical protein
MISANSPGRLLGLVFIGAAFMAAAAIVLGGYGVSPGLIPAAMFIGVFVLKTIFGTRYFAERLVLRTFLPFILVVAWALLSSYLMPRFFESQILVWPEKLSSFVVITPLEPNSGNMTQDMYLLAAALLAVCAASYLTQTGFDLRRLLNAYFAAGLMVVAISLWQLASHLTGIWFPTTFFLSNPGWAQLSNESIGGFIRITGPGSEPSELAAYLCGSVGATGWIVLNGHPGRLPKLLLVLATLVTLLSTSTTGYAALALMLFLTLIYTILFGSNILRRNFIMAALGGGALTAALIVTVPVVAPGVAHSASVIFNATLNKQHSSSYTDRTSADHDSVREMFESDGLGVGWGSNRSSSLVPGLAASIGVFGIAGLVWFALNIAASVRRAHRLTSSPELRQVMHGCTGGIIGTLSAAVVSAPTITSPDFFLLIAMLIATAARIRLDADQRRSTIPSRTSQFSPGYLTGHRASRI